MDIRDRNSRRGFLGNKHVFGDQGPGAQVLPGCQTTPEHGPHIRQFLGHSVLVRRMRIHFGNRVTQIRDHSKLFHGQ